MKKYLYGAKVTLFLAHVPSGNGCTCSLCGKDIFSARKHSPVRVTPPDGVGEYRFHGACYKIIIQGAKKTCDEISH